ncbi:MAG: ABC transporter substrate-binding protein [Thermodesulfobacteriota bacterium]
MRKTKSGKVFLIGFSLFLIYFLAFFQPANASPSKPKSVKVAFIGDISGPYAAITGATYYGMTDALEYVNKELGGINGVKMEGVIKDDGGRVAVGVSHYMEVREMKPRPAMVYIIVSALGEALRERLAEDKIVAISVTGVPAIYPAKYTFGWFPIYPDLFGAFIDWLKETWKETRAPRVAFLTWDSTYGRGPVTPEAYAYAKSKGVEMVAEELFTPRDVFVGTQLFRIRAKKADWIYTNTTANAPSIIVTSARESAIKINLAGGLGMDWSSVYIAGKAAMEGAISVYPNTSLDEENHKGIKILRRYFEKNKRKKFDWNYMYQLAWQLVVTTRDVVKRVVDKDGWDNVKGETIKREMESLRDYRPLDLIHYTTTPKKHAPDKTYIMRFTDGKMIPIGGLRTCPDLRPAEFK